jgi:hypothetical protein
MLALLLLAAWADEPPRGPEIRAEVGAEVDRSPHGIVTVGLGWGDVDARAGRLELQLLTDTLDLRWQVAPNARRAGLPAGRVWVAARSQLGAGGLLITRWNEGRLTPERNQLAFAHGIDAGGVFYGPAGLYAGGELRGRAWHFAALPATAAPLLRARGVLTADAVVGLYHPFVHVWIQAGVDLSLLPGTPGAGADTATGAVAAPHAHVTLATSFPWIVRPLVAVRAGLAAGQDEVTATRLGGLNPYVVPLAGAAWAEFYVEDYVAVRAGPEVGQRGERWSWAAALTADVAQFRGLPGAGDADGLGRHVGFAAHGRVAERGRWGEIAVGWAPWLPRDAGPALAVYGRLGVDFGRGLRPRA